MASTVPANGLSVTIQIVLCGVPFCGARVCRIAYAHCLQSNLNIKFSMSFHIMRYLDQFCRVCSQESFKLFYSESKRFSIVIVHIIIGWYDVWTLGDRVA